jgi:hypothetical protein
MEGVPNQKSKEERLRELEESAGKMEERIKFYVEQLEKLEKDNPIIAVYLKFKDRAKENNLHLNDLDLKFDEHPDVKLFRDIDDQCYGMQKHLDGILKEKQEIEKQ